MKPFPVVLSALVGAGLVVAAVNVLLDGAQPTVNLASTIRPAPAAQVVAEDVPEDVPGDIQVDVVQPVSRAVDEPGVRVRDVLLVVNKDGSASVGASVENGDQAPIALAGVVVSVQGQRQPVNATEMWLPVPAGQRSVVGAASDAGGFVVPTGITKATRVDLEFRFDDGTCVLADVTAVARTGEHSSVFPRSGKPIGPVTTDEPPVGTTACGR